MAESKDKKLQKVLTRLKAARRENPKKYRKGAAAGKITSDLPKAWREVLQLCDGFEIRDIDALDVDSVSMDHAKELARNQEPMLENYEQLTGKKPKG